MSVGHLARIFEEADISTVIIAVRGFRDQLASMMLPRVVITPHLMGRPLGAPGDIYMQRSYIMTALELLDKAERAGTIIDI